MAKVMTQSEVRAIKALFGRSTVLEAKRRFNRSYKTIVGIWRECGEYKYTPPVAKNDLSAREALVEGLLRAAGPTGALLSDIECLLRVKGYHVSMKSCQATVSHVNLKLRAQGKPECVARLSKTRQPSRYAIIPAEPVVLKPKPSKADIIIWTPSIPSVSRRISGDLGLGATPGAIVSVARVSFLDGAPA